MAPRPRRVFVATVLLAVGVLLIAGLTPQASSLTPQASSPKPQAPSLPQGLGQFAGGVPPCKPDETATPAAPQGADYKPNAPDRSSLIEPSAAGTKLVLTGTVSGLTCGPIKRARVEFWHADPSGGYDKRGFRFRGRQLTDEAGRYRLETIVPGASGARPRKLYVRVQPPGGRAFTTQLFFPDDPQNKTDPAFRPELVMKVSDGKDGKVAVFDIVLNI